MRKKRLMFWVVSLVICVIIIVGYKNNEKKIPEEEKQLIKVYCSDEKFEKYIEKRIRKSSIGKTHKAVFIDNKDEAELIFTDEILALDNGYEKITWSPLVIAVDNSSKKMKSYEKEGYITYDGGYTIEFDKIIKATLSGEWKEKIYYPSLDTREGKLFFDFVLVNINGGRYPRNEEEMQACVNEANEFLDCDTLVQYNSKEKLLSEKSVKDELYITFENDLHEIVDKGCECEISYPSNTILREWYWKCTGENAEKIKECLTYKLRVNEIFSNEHIRNESNRSFQCKHYAESSGFSYVELPLKEE